MIVLVVLGVLGVLMMLVLDLAADATLAGQMMGRAVQADQAYQIAVSTASRSLEAFRNQDPNVCTLLDAWSLDPPPQHLDGFEVTIHLEDEERLFNPNHLLDTSGNVDDSRLQVFRRMLLQLDQREDFSNAVLDWLDADAQRREPLGAESLDYKGRRAKNQRLDSPEELQWIMGATPAMLQGQRRGDRSLPPLTTLLTVHSAGFINVNTADAWVLRALAPNLSDNVVSAITEARRTRPFKSIDDMFGVPGVTRDHLFYIKKVGDIKSATWRVEVTVTPEDPGADLRLRLTAIYRRTSKGFTPLFWNVGEVSPPESGSSTASPTRPGRRTPAASPEAPRLGPSSLPSTRRGPEPASPPSRL